MTASTHQGLIIQGGAALNFPPPASGYARRAYGDVTPDFGPSPWLVVRPDGSILVLAGKVEYGQGIRTGLAIEVADELRVPLERVEVVLGDTARVPWDMGTFGSQSTARVGLQLRKAAATARQVMLELAADRLDLPVDALSARDGRVASVSDAARSLGYGELLGAEIVVREVDDHDAPRIPEDVQPAP